MLTKTNARRAANAAILATLVGTLGACGDHPTTKAVHEADVEFTKVSGGPSAPKAYAEQVYSEIDVLLTPHSGKGPKGTAEAVAVMLASAKQGLAASATEDAADADAEVRSKTRIVMAHGSKWSRLNALAEAAATYDAAPELADIDEGLRQSRAELAELEQAQNEADARLAELQSEIDDLRSRSSEARSQAGVLQLEMSQASSQRGVELAPRVRDLLLQADRLELDARRVETTRDQYQPFANEINLNIDRVNKQRELLTRSRTETNTRARDAEADETRLRATASQAAETLAEQVSELERYRQNDADDAFDKAISLAQAASTNARLANDAARESGNVTGAIANQALGLLELRRAQMHLDVANLFDSLAVLGMGDQFANLRDGAREDADSAHQSATSALEQAASIMRRIRAPGETGERLSRSADMLERYAQTPLGEMPDLLGTAETTAPQELDSPTEASLDEEGFTDGPSELEEDG